jgi:hypothetical protein
MARKKPKELPVIGSAKAANVLLKTALKRLPASSSETVRSLMSRVMGHYKVPSSFGLPLLLYPYEFPLLKETLCARELPTEMFDMSEAGAFLVYDPLLAGSKIWVGNNTKNVDLESARLKLALLVGGSNSEGVTGELLFIPADQYFTYAKVEEEAGEVYYEE